MRGVLYKFSICIVHRENFFLMCEVKRTFFFLMCEVKFSICIVHREKFCQLDLLAALSGLSCVFGLVYLVFGLVFSVQLDLLAALPGS